MDGIVQLITINKNKTNMENKEQTRYYYLVNGKLMWALSKMPNPSGFNIKYSEWHSSLRHCLNIKDDDIKKVIEKVFSINPKLDIPIEVTELITDNDGVVTFMEKQRDVITSDYLYYITEIRS